ncbi:MAG: RimK/LysX family protein [Fimbriimonadaceae bacterium]|nr:ATP-dependent zinc protease [Chthonomonadaceae bacterium]MCO5295993.1 RimK/LysX family protein [Fimbriimonadaceae bacterium]
MITIGYLESVSFPDWGIENVLAKADTGARTSAIDVRTIEELPGSRVRFEVVVDREPAEHTWVEADIVRRTRIKSSFGRSHDRLVVIARIKIGDVETEAELGLVCRKRMRCRMLIGRTTLEDQFLVDSGRTFVMGGKPKRKRRKKETVDP